LVRRDAVTRDLSGLINVNSVIGGNLNISSTGKNNTAKIEDTSNAGFSGDTLDGRDGISTSRGTVGLDADVSDIFSTEFEGLLSFKVFLEFSNSKGIPTGRNDKTGTVGDSGDIARSGSGFITSRSKPLGKDIAGSVSIRVKTDFLGGLDDITSESGDKVNVINVGKIDTDSIVASSGTDKSLDTDDIVDDVIRDRDLVLLDTDLNDSISTKGDTVLDIFAQVNPMKRDLVISIGSIR